MKKKHLISIGALLGIALLLLAVFFYPKPKTFPEPLGYVSDYENVFTPIQKNRLEERLSNYEAETSREIAVVTIASTSPYNNINDYATDLGNEWGVGKEDINNGLLIVLCKNSREIRISTGYGTEKSLTDSICQRVIDKTMIPYFREGNYFDGIDVGLDELMQYWK
ncbi:MAG: TPM domain-containing protein [Flavobacteriaceae bacterium]|nr:TPM domain-containing protein [Flavobacteriaceae bacterium]